MFKRPIQIISALSALVALASCSSDGGGGGGGGSVEPPQPPVVSAKLPITAENAPLITAGVLQAVTSAAELVDTTDVVIGVPVKSSATAKISQGVLQTVITETLPCDSGSMTITWNDADDDFEVSPGDSLEVAFENCDLLGQAMLHGATTFTVLAITGDVVSAIAPWSFEATIGFDSLWLTDSEGTAMVDGDLRLATGSEDGLTVDLSIASDSLSAAVSEVVEYSQTLSDFNLTETLDLNTLQMVISADGVLASTLMEGSVSFETLAAFVAIGDDYPYEGVMLIADGVSSVLVTVLSNMSVQLEVDEDLDGSIDATLTVAWSDLVPED